MFRASPAVRKMASTHGGMNTILKRRLPVQRYIELAVKAGSYKSPSTRPNYLGLHDVPQTKPEEYLTPREREERIKMRRGILGQGGAGGGGERGPGSRHPSPLIYFRRWRGDCVFFQLRHEP